MDPGNLIHSTTTMTPAKKHIFVDLHMDHIFMDHTLRCNAEKAVH